jgi:Zn-dependent metalloprotease
LEYERQPGALNESMSDVFGSLIKQWSLGQLADEADWLIGADIFTPGIGADALRSMRSPGRAYDNELFGKDPQPDHMDGYYPGPDDNFGVHINSGIPNKAFFLTATAIGGKAWEIPGQIWYNALLASHRLTQFQEFADTTYLKAQEYGSSVSQVVADAWREVGIRVAVAPGAIRAAAGNSGRNSQFDEIAKGLTKQLESLAGEVKSLAKEVKAIKERR